MTKVKQSDIQRAELGNSVARVANPEGGAAFLSGTGAIKITLPQNASMTRFVVDIFRYTGDDNSGATIFLGGRPVLDSWYRTFAQIVGSSDEVNFKIRFGYDDTSPCVWIGEITDDVSNLAVVVRDFVAIQSNTVKEWGFGWDVSLATTLGTIITTKVNNLVYCSESQIKGTVRTFTEVQTFGNSPVVPDAVNDNEAVNLGQVREEVAAGGGGAGGSVISSIIPVTENYLLTTASNNAILRVKDYASVIVPSGLGLKHRTVIKKATGKTVSLTAGENVVLETPTGYVSQILAQNDAVEIVLEEIDGGIEYWGVYGALVASDYDLPLALSVPQTTVITDALIFPIIYKSSDWPEITTTKDYFILYSSDHDYSLPTSEAGKCYWGEMDDPEGSGFVERGVIHSGNQGETPLLVRGPDAGSGHVLYLFYSEHTGAMVNGYDVQESRLKTTAGGAALHNCTFTDRGYVLGLMTDEQHTGYLKIHKKLDNTYIAHHLTNGEPINKYGISTSPDLINWTRVTSDATKTPAGIPTGFNIGLGRTRIFPFWINGVLYGVYKYVNDTDSSDVRLGVGQLDESTFLPSVFIRELAQIDSYDGQAYIENDILYFFIYLDGSDGSGGANTGNAFLYKYYIPDTI